METEGKKIMERISSEINKGNQKRDIDSEKEGSLIVYQDYCDWHDRG